MRTPSKRKLRFDAISKAADRVRRAQDLLDHTDRLSYIETRARRVMALDLIQQARAALRAAHEVDHPT